MNLGWATIDIHGQVTQHQLLLACPPIPNEYILLLSLLRSDLTSILPLIIIASMISFGSSLFSFEVPVFNWRGKILGFGSGEIWSKIAQYQCELWEIQNYFATFNLCEDNTSGYDAIINERAHGLLMQRETKIVVVACLRYYNILNR